MATKRTRIIVNLQPHIGSVVKAHAAKQGRSRSNFLGEIIKDWVATAPMVVEEEQAPYGELEKKPKKHNKPA